MEEGMEKAQVPEKEGGDGRVSQPASGAKITLRELIDSFISFKAGVAYEFGRALFLGGAAVSATAFVFYLINTAINKEKPAETLQKPAIELRPDYYSISGSRNNVLFVFAGFKNSQTSLSLVKEDPEGLVRYSTWIQLFDNNGDGTVDVFHASHRYFTNPDNYPLQFEKANRIFAEWRKSLDETIKEAQREWVAKYVQARVLDEYLED